MPRPHHALAPARLLVALLAPALVAPACGGSTSPAPAASTSPRPAADAAPAATPVTSWIGIVTAAHSADLGPSRSGRLAELPAQVGQPVQPGQLVARLHTEELAQELRVAEAEVAAASAALRDAGLGVTAAAQRHRRSQAIGAGLSAEARELDELALERARALQAQRAADLAQRRARVAQLRQRLADSEVRAPFAGVVAERLVEPGTVVAAGTPLVRLVDDGRLVVRFAVPPEESVAVGAPVQVRLPGGALRRAIVDRVAPEIDTLARLRVVEALFAPGATADAPALPGTGVLVGPDPAR